MTEIRARLLELLERRPDLSAPQIGAYTTLGTSTIRNLVAGKKEYGARVDEELARVMDQIAAGEILQAGSEPVTVTEDMSAGRKVPRQRDVYLTETVRRVGQVLDYCSENALVGVVTGSYGVGKTEAVSLWLEGKGREIGALSFEFNEFSANGVCDFIFDLARHLGAVGRRGRQNGGLNFQLVVDHLLEHPRFLILDQCESVSPRVLQVIRQIWDKTRHAGVGVAMLASPLLMEKLRGNRVRDVGALTSRVSIWAPLKGLQRAEIVHIVEQEGIRNIEPEALDLLIRATGGSIRRLMAVTEMIVSKHGNKLVTERTIEGVAAHLWGLNTEPRMHRAVPV